MEHTSIFTSLGKSVDEIISLIEEKQPLRVVYHDDADGLASIALIRSVFEVEESDKYPYSPEVFGGYKEGDLAVDIGQPLFKSYNGVCIDHHDHPDPWYPLIWSTVPTGLIIYYVLKDRIPDDKLFLVVLSCQGDGQPELIPDEIWDKLWDSLWEHRGTLYKERYGRGLNVYSYPIFSLIASPVNSLCRTGHVTEAYRLVTRARSIHDLVDSALGETERQAVQEEENRVLDPRNPLKIKVIDDVFGLVMFRSRYNIGSRIAASVLSKNPYLTIIALNLTTNTMSIRGILAKYVANKLQKLGFHAGGHPGYCGGQLLNGQTPDHLIEALRRIRRV